MSGGAKPSTRGLLDTHVEVEQESFNRAGAELERQGVPVAGEIVGDDRV
jgi:hypothetical protein